MGNSCTSIVRALVMCALLSVAASPCAQAADLLVGNYTENSIKRYNGSTGAFLSNFVAPNAGGLRGPAAFVIGPDGNLYVSSNATGSVKRYNGSTGAYINDFVPPSTGGIANPGGLVFGPDKNLYVAIGLTPNGAGKVARYNGTTGAYMGDFVAKGSGELIHAQDLVFGPDGNLYVADNAIVTGAIRRYNGTTGAFTGNFVSNIVGGPTSLKFGPDANLYVSLFYAAISAIRRYDGRTGADQGAFVVAGGGGLLSSIYLAFGPDRNLYATERNSSSVKRYSGTNGEYLGDFVKSIGGEVVGLLWIDSASQPPPLTIATSSLAGGEVGATYSQTLSATGGTPPYGSWTRITGSLPNGLTLNASTGVVSGTPSTVTGSPFSFSVTVRDNAGTTSAPKSLSIAVLPPPVVTTPSLPGGVVNVAYSATLAASGGTPPYSNWTVSAGTLPTSLTLNPSTGVISGTPSTATGSPFSFSVTVRDSVGSTSVAKSLSIAVLPAPVVTTTSLPGGVVNVAYSATLAASGGTPPYSNWTVSAGTLPPPLTLNASTGVIGGTPSTATGSPFSFSVTVRDSVGSTSVAKSLSIAVLPPPVVTTTSLPGGVVSVAYSATLAASGGTPPYSNWTVSAGTLPPSLTLNPSTGVISGTPSTITGSPFSFSVTVRDSAGRTSVARPLSLSVRVPDLTLSCAAGSAPVRVNSPYSRSCSISGGLPPYKWSITGTLPPGVSLTSDAGSTSGVNGTPTIAGTYTYSIQVTDNSSTPLVASQPIGITVDPVPLSIVCTTSTGPTRVGLSYSASCTASGGTPPYSWSISPGPLPVGLALTAITGTSSGVTGTPTAAGTYGYTVRVMDSTTPTSLGASQGYSGAIQPGIPVVACTVSNGPTQVGVPYSTSCSVSGGAPPYTWSINPGALPAGLSLTTVSGSTSGVSGTPTTGGAFLYSIRVVDGETPEPQIGTKIYSGTIAASPTVSCAPSAGPTRVGIAYSTTCTASGGTAPYNWSIVAGSLPAGLSLSVTTGVSVTISGTPSESGAYDYTVRATDSALPTPQNAGQRFAGAIQPPSATLAVTCTSANGPAQLSVSYSVSCTASGGTAPYNWSIGAGSLPAGLSLSAATGPTVAISGTPSTAGTYDYTVRVTDASTPSAQSASQHYSGTIPPPPATLTVTCTPANGPAQVGVAHSNSCTASGGIAPYNWSIVAGSLPAGLSLSAITGATVTISGTPSESSAYDYTVRATDSALPTPQNAGQRFTGTTAPATLTVTCTPANGPAQVGVAHSNSCTASGGVAPYNWSINPGTLPAGLSLSAITGATVTISGVPTNSGPYSYSIRVGDSSLPAQSASQPFTGSIGAATLTVNCSTAAGPTRVGTEYSASCAVSGGTAPYNWSISPGSLPNGLSLGSTTGASVTFSGTPSIAGPYNFSVKVTDTTSPVPQTASQAYTGAIQPITLTLSCAPSTGPTTIGVSYSSTCSASGGTAPYSWSIVSGALPAGLVLSSPSGTSATISGTPSAAAPYNFTVLVTDSTSPAPQNASQIYTGAILNTTLTLNCAPAGGPTLSGVPYAATCSVAGGTPPYNWSISAGSLPAGLSLSAGAGSAITLAGIPTVTGAYNFTVRVSDGGTPNPQSASKVYAGTISDVANPGATMSVACTPSTGPAAVGVSYTATCAASEGVAPYTWSIGAGALPAGLSLNASSGVISGTPLAPGVFGYAVKATDSATPAHSASQAYSGSITPATLSINPQALSFSFQPGGTVPAQTLAITSNAALTYSISVGPGCAWLKVTPVTGITPASIGVSADPTGLSASTYNCTISAAAGGSTRSVFVSFAVSGPALAASPSSITFNSLPGGAALPSQRIVGISAGSGASVSFSAVPSCSWVTLSPSSGITPASLAISVSAAGLTTPGSYSCAVAINGTGAVNTPQISVTLLVNNATLSAPAAISFSATQGSTSPAVRNVQVTGPTISIPFTPRATTTSGGNWLKAPSTQSSTPANLAIQADPSGLAAGTYTGAVILDYVSGPQTVNVSFTVSAPSLPLLTVAPSPLVFRFNSGSAPPAQTVSVLTSNNSPVTFAARSTGPIAVTAIPGSRNVTVSVNPGLQPGTYTNGSVVVSTQTGSTNPSEQVVPVTVVVDAGLTTPVLTAAPANLTFPFTQGATAVTQLLAVSNLGGGTLMARASASAASGGAWLSVTPQQANVDASSAPFSVTADPSQVVPDPLRGVAGTYSGEILLVGANGAQSVRIPVTMTITASPTVVLSRSALSFTAVEGGAAAPSETLDVLPAGLLWNASAATLPAGSRWLSVASASQTRAAVSVDAAGLTPGTYYGSIRITASDSSSGVAAANSPQTVSVVLNVLPSGAYPSPVVRPSGLSFSAQAGAASVPVQTVNVFNLSSRPLSYTSAAVTSDGGNWCAASPASSAPGGITAASFSINVQVDYSRLTEGIRNCNLRLLFSDGSLQTINVTAVVNFANAIAAANPEPRTRALLPGPAAGPTCDTLVPVLRQPGQGFNVTAFQSASLEVAILDSCGNAVDGAILSVFFSNNDPTLHPARVEKGIYRGTWTPRNVPQNVGQSPVAINVVVQPAIGQSFTAGGSIVIGGTVSLTLKNVTQISSEGVLNSGSYTNGGQVSPGSWVAVFGENLADRQAVADATPFSTQLGDTRVMLGSQALPLLYVNSGQVNAQIPFGLNPNTQHQMQVIHQQDQSEPAQITVAETQPAIFTKNQAGFGQGAIFWTMPDGSHVLADSLYPVTAGAVLEIYATGLGALAPEVAGGQVSPSNPPAATRQTVTATIGGLPAIVRFAGLTPGSVGLYQVNAVVPDGVPPGDSVPVVIMVGGQVSQSGATIAVR